MKLIKQHYFFGNLSSVEVIKTVKETPKFLYLTDGTKLYKSNLTLCPKPKLSEWDYANIVEYSYYSDKLLLKLNNTFLSIGKNIATKGDDANGCKKNVF